MDGPLSPRALIRKHKHPIDAFESADPEGKGELDLKTTRRVLQNLGVPASAIQMTAFGRKYAGENGKNSQAINYRKLLADHEIPLSSVDQHMHDLQLGSNSNSNSNKQPSSTRQTTAKPIPGNPARKDTYKPEDSHKSRLLKFESDSHDFPHYYHGNNGVELSSPTISMRRGKKNDYPQRDMDYTKHKLAVVGSDLAEEEAYHAHEEADVRNFSHADGSMGESFQDTIFSGGEIADAGGVGRYVTDVKAHVPISSEYLATFPGDKFPRTRPNDVSMSTGKVAKAGGVIKFMNDESWKDEHPEGYLPALPNGLMDIPRAIVDDPINQRGALIGAGSAGIAVWAQDSAALDAAYARTRKFHYDPIYHSGEINTNGGIHGVANADRTWLQDTPTAPGMQYQTTPPGMKNKNKGAHRSKSASRTSGKNRSAGRRRSVPDLLAGRYTTTSLADHVADRNGENQDDDEADLEADVVLGADESTEQDVDALVSGIARRDRSLYQSSLQIAGPLTSAAGVHHDRMAFCLGTRSPVAVAIAATPLVKFDTRKLALVRKHIRSKLPSKAVAAVASLKHRLNPRDGDQDGKLTDSELLSALTDMMPDLHAEEVGLLIRYMRHRNSRRTAAERLEASNNNTATGNHYGATSSSSSLSTATPNNKNYGPEDVAQLTVNTASFGEGIDVAELADWIIKQPGGSEEISNPIYKDGYHTITSFSTSPPSAREENAMDSLEHHSHKKAVKGSTAADDTHIRYPNDSPNERYEHVRPSIDSSAAKQAIFDVEAPFEDPRKIAAEAAKNWGYNAEVGSLLSAHTFASTRTKGGSRKLPLGYQDYYKLRRQISSEFARGDADAPAAGLLGGDKRSTVGSKGDSNNGADTTTTDRTEWAEKNAKFETFRATWESKHGSAAAKEIKLDASEPKQGPTWTRTTPTPFKVLHLAQGPKPPSTAASSSSSSSSASLNR